MRAALLAILALVVISQGFEIHRRDKPQLQATGWSTNKN